MSEVNLFQFEARASDDDLKRALELTCIECDTVLCDIEDGDSMGTLVDVVSDHVCTEEFEETAICVHCGRAIGRDSEERWVDPEATGDDSVWRETCADNHNDRVAAHEPGAVQIDLSDEESFPCKGCGINLYTAVPEDGILTCPICGTKEAV